MKLKRRITAIFVLAILVTALVITAVANEQPEYTGTVEEATGMLSSATALEDLTAKQKALDELVEYVKTIDENAEGLADLNANIDMAELDVAIKIFAEIKNDFTPAEKNPVLVKVASFLSNHSIADTTEGYEEFNAGYTSQCTAVVEYYLNQATVETAVATKHSNLDAFENFVKKTNFKLSEDNEKAAADAGLACAVIYLNSVNTESSNSTCGKAIRTLDSFLNDHRITTTGETYETYAESYATKKAAYEKNLKDALAALSLSVPADCFPYSSTHELTFDKEGEKGTITPDNNIINSANYAKIENGKDGDNSYFTLGFPVLSKHVRINSNIKTITDYAVIEFDFTTFSSLPKRDIWIEDGATMLLKITPAGNLVAVHNDTKQNVTLLSAAVVKGEWMRISLVINVKMSTLDVYVDYEKVGDSISLKTQSGTFYTPNNFRIGANPNTTAGGEFSIDNFYIYKATAPMDVAAVSQMTDDQLISYYAERMLDGTLPKRTRNSFYNKITELLPDYYENGSFVGTPSDDVKAAISSYLTFKEGFAENFAPLLSAETLTWMEDELAALTAYSKGEATNSIRNTLLNRCKNLLTEVESDINKEDDRYKAIMDEISRLSNDLGTEAMAKEFVSYVNSFFAAIDISKKQEYCDLALERLESLRLSDHQYLQNPALFPNFCKAYEQSKTLRDTLADLDCLDRSKKLFSCLTFLKNYSTEEQWAQEFDYLNIFVTIANDIIKSGIYDPYYRNLSSMIEEYEPIRSYFYEKLQNDHITLFETELAKFNNTTQFFERYAITESLKAYAESNDIDYSNERLVALIQQNLENYAAIDSEREAYADLIAENTEMFIEKCAELIGSIDYATMKQRFDEASVYYYVMDVSDARAIDALNIYSVRRDEIRAAEANAEEFILATALLDDVTKNPLDVMINCSKYLDKVNINVKGVSTAIDKLNDACREYDAEVAKTNLEINSVNTLVVSLANTTQMNRFMNLVSQALAR